MMNVDFDTFTRPCDDIVGERVKWAHDLGEMRGWRAASQATQARAVPGYRGAEPHKWFLLVADEDAWFRVKHEGGELAADEAMWVPLDRVVID